MEYFRLRVLRELSALLGEDGEGEYISRVCVLDTLDETTDSRIFQYVNGGPAEDGNWWQGFANLVSKYGLMPKSTYPESENSRHTSDFIQYTNPSCASLLSKCAQPTLPAKALNRLRERKDEYMKLVYRMCCIALGEPPCSFDFFARVEDDASSKKEEKRTIKIRRTRSPAPIRASRL